jgi:hypothetical protein
VSAVGPGQQLVDVAIWMSLDDPRQDVSEIGERIDVVEPAGLGQEAMTVQCSAPPWILQRARSCGRAADRAPDMGKAKEV